MTRPTTYRRMAPIGLIALALTMAACDVAFQGMHASASDRWTRTYALAEGGLFELNNVNGAIEVTPSQSATSVEVVAERMVRDATEEAAREQLKAFGIEEQVAPNEVRITVPRAQRTSGVHLGGRWREANFKVKVPKNAVVKVTTRNGAVHLSGLGGPVKVQTSNGEITGEQLAGALDAATTNGAIKVHVAAVQEDGIRLDTTNGGIDLRMPATAKATISARWSHGGFEANGLKPEGELERRRYNGKLNGGGPRIELATTNGGIRISS